jgi:hypothetical protein
MVESHANLCGNILSWQNRSVFFMHTMCTGSRCVGRCESVSFSSSHCREKLRWTLYTKSWRRLRSVTSFVIRDSRATFSHTFPTHHSSGRYRTSKLTRPNKHRILFLLTFLERALRTLQHSALQRATTYQNGWRSELEEVMAPRAHVQPEARLGRRKESSG